MPRQSITFTQGFADAVADYQRRHNLSSWSQAVVELAAKALEFEGEPAPTWGGWRGNEASLDNLIRRVDKLTDYGRNDPTEDDG